MQHYNNYYLYRGSYHFPPLQNTLSTRCCLKWHLHEGKLTTNLICQSIFTIAHIKYFQAFDHIVSKNSFNLYSSIISPRITKSNCTNHSESCCTPDWSWNNLIKEMLLPWFVLESLISVTLQIIVKWNYIQILINVIGYKTNRLDRFGIGPIMKVDDLILLPRIDDGTHASCFGNTLFDDLILILLAEKQASNSMDTLEEIKNCPFCIHLTWLQALFALHQEMEKPYGSKAPPHALA